MKAYNMFMFWVELLKSQANKTTMVHLEHLFFSNALVSTFIKIINYVNM